MSRVTISQNETTSFLWHEIPNVVVSLVHVYESYQNHHHHDAQCLVSRTSTSLRSLLKRKLYRNGHLIRILLRFILGFFVVASMMRVVSSHAHHLFCARRNRVGDGDGIGAHCSLTMAHRTENTLPLA